MDMTDDPRYPIGPFAPYPTTPETRRGAIADIAGLPARIRAAVDGLDEQRLDTPYRDGGWTVRQLVHHVADSHMNGLIRVKLALTEDNPTIKPYDENAWARLRDVKLPIELSLTILDSVHARWIAVYEGMNTADFDRTFFHPERKESLTLDAHTQLYSWHSRHHVAHITALRKRMGW
jgi:hypothetical protein